MGRTRQVVVKSRSVPAGATCGLAALDEFSGVISLMFPIFLLLLAVFSWLGDLWAGLGELRLFALTTGRSLPYSSFSSEISKFFQTPGSSTHEAARVLPCKYFISLSDIIPAFSSWRENPRRGISVGKRREEH